MPSFAPFLDYFPWYAAQLAKCEADGVKVVDMAFGNPNDAPSAELMAALKRPLEEEATAATFRYEPRREDICQALSDSLWERRQVRFDAQDISLCNAALSGLLVCLQALTDPGDEVLCVSPSYFFYGAMLDLCGLRRVLVPAKAGDFDLDIDAMEAALTPRTRVVMVNSPNNPSGRIYPAETLQRLATMLAAAKTRLGLSKPIVVISDEAYVRIRFDDAPFPSPTSYLPYSLLVYTFGKTVLAPSERLGFIAISPLMPEGARKQVREALRKVQLAGFSFPNGVLARALPDIDRVIIDVPQLQRRRDMLVAALEAAGWTATKPQATFYMLVKVPLAVSGGDDQALVDLLAKRGLIVMPGTASHLPGWIRLSLTASDEMVALAIDIFNDVAQQLSLTRPAAA